jgi:hypothetical protein
MSLLASICTLKKFDTHAGSKPLDSSALVALAMTCALRDASSTDVPLSHFASATCSAKASLRADASNGFQKFRDVQRVLPGDGDDFLNCFLTHTSVFAGFTDGQIRLANFDRVPAYIVQRSDRIKHKKLTHLGIGQVADGFADVQHGILKIFGPHHRLAVTSLQIPKLVDVVMDRERFDIVARKQDAAAACDLLGREVQEVTVWCANLAQAYIRSH